MVVARDTTMEPISPSELGRGHMGPLERNIGVLHWGMRPAGEIGPTRQMDPVDVLGVKSQSAVRPLSVEAVEFSPALEPQTVVIAGRQTVSSDAVGPVVIADVPAPTLAGSDFRLWRRFTPRPVMLMMKSWLFKPVSNPLYAVQALGELLG